MGRSGRRSSTFKMETTLQLQSKAPGRDLILYDTLQTAHLDIAVVVPAGTYFDPVAYLDPD